MKYISNRIRYHTCTLPCIWMLIIYTIVKTGWIRISNCFNKLYRTVIAIRALHAIPTCYRSSGHFVKWGSSHPPKGEMVSARAFKTTSRPHRLLFAVWLCKSNFMSKQVGSPT